MEGNSNPSLEKKASIKETEKRSSLKPVQSAMIHKESMKPGQEHRRSSVKFSQNVKETESRRGSSSDGQARKKSSLRFKEDADKSASSSRKSSTRTGNSKPGSQRSSMKKRSTFGSNPSKLNITPSKLGITESKMSMLRGSLGYSSSGDIDDDDDDSSDEEPGREFYGSTTDINLIERRQNIVRCLKKRNWDKEQRTQAPPHLIVKHIDLNLTEKRKELIKEVFPVEVLTRLDSRVPVIDHEVLTDYELQLPSVGQTRYKTMGKPVRDKLKTKPRIVMPKEGFVKNPFFIPENVPQYMIQHEQERIQQRIKDAGVPTKEKLNAKSLIEKVVADRVKPYLGEDAIVDAPTVYNTIKWEAGHGLNISHIQKASRKLHANYLSNRKNLFYAEYCILAREKALAKIRDAEEAEERALQNYEYLSSYTAESLEVFLQENEEWVNSAARAAEDICKENIDLLNQGRNLRFETANMKAEIVGLNDRLREFKFYMKFLDGVTKEFMRKDDEDRFRTERRQQQIKEELTGYLKRGFSLKQALSAIKKRNKKYIGDKKARTRKTSIESESAEYLRKLQEQMKTQALRPPIESKITSLLKILSAHAHSANSKFDEEALLWELDLVGGDERTDREELGNLIFTHPDQLLSIYEEVKEHNITISRRATMNEGILDELDNRIKNFRKESEVRARNLRDVINNIEKQMTKASEQIEVLNMLIDKFTGGYYDVKGQERMMNLLRKHVDTVYKSAIGNHDAHLTSVMMLTSIEKHFEDIVCDLDSMPPEVVAKISADLEKERRESERIDQERQRLIRQNTRLSKSLERAQAPIKRKKGLNLIFRSRPPRSAVHLTQKDLDKKAEADEWDYYFGED